MLNSKSFRLLAFALLSALAGCASTPPDSGFADVQKMAAARTGQSVQWDIHSPADQEADEKLKAMLAEDLSVDQAVQIALLHNRNLQATYEELGIAQADLVQAGLLRNPVFNASLRFPDGGGKSNLEFSVADDFLSILLIPLKKKVAQAQSETTKLHIVDAILQLACDTRVAYYQAQGAAQMAGVQDLALKTKAVALLAAQRMHDAGNLSDLDLATAQADEAQSRDEVFQANFQLITARERLMSLLGIPGDPTQIRLNPQLPEIPVADRELAGLENQAVAQRPDLLAARAEIVTSARRLGLANPFASASDAQIGLDTERETSGQWVTGPTFSLPIPLFDQGQGTIAKAQAELRQAQDRFVASATQARSQVRAAFVRMHVARNRAMNFQRNVVPLRQQIVEQTQRQYNGMLVGIFQLIQAKQGEIEANKSYVASLLDFWIASTELDRAIGGPLVASAPTTQTSEINSLAK